MNRCLRQRILRAYARKTRPSASQNPLHNTCIVLSQQSTKCHSCRRQPHGSSAIGCKAHSEGGWTAALAGGWPAALADLAQINVDVGVGREWLVRQKTLAGEVEPVGESATEVNRAIEAEVLHIWQDGQLRENREGGQVQLIARGDRRRR